MWKSPFHPNTREKFISINISSHSSAWSDSSNTAIILCKKKIVAKQIDEEKNCESIFVSILLWLERKKQDNMNLWE